MLLRFFFHPIVSLYIVMQLLWDYSFGDIDPCTHSLSLLLCKSRDIHNKQGSYGNKISLKKAYWNYVKTCGDLSYKVNDCNSYFGSRSSEKLLDASLGYKNRLFCWKSALGSANCILLLLWKFVVIVWNIESGLLRKQWLLKIDFCQKYVLYFLSQQLWRQKKECNHMFIVHNVWIRL